MQRLCAFLKPSRVRQYIVHNMLSTIEGVQKLHSVYSKHMQSVYQIM